MYMCVPDVFFPDLPSGCATLESSGSLVSDVNPPQCASCVNEGYVHYSSENKCVSKYQTHLALYK